ncbi:hypothetical protein BDW67DRAFT_155183 [Aspergillus spinulosporus]
MYSVLLTIVRLVSCVSYPFCSQERWKAGTTRRFAGDAICDILIGFAACSEVQCANGSSRPRLSDLYLDGA